MLLLRRDADVFWSQRRISGDATMYDFVVVFADVNECETSEPAPCNNSEYCINSPGSYDCQGTCRSRLVAAG